MRPDAGRNLCVQGFWRAGHVTIAQLSKQLKLETPRLNLVQIINYGICAKTAWPTAEVQPIALGVPTKPSILSIQGWYSWYQSIVACARNKQTDAVNQGRVHNGALLSQHPLPKDKGISVGVDNSHPYPSSSSLAIKGYRTQRNILRCVLQELLSHRITQGKKCSLWSSLLHSSGWQMQECFPLLYLAIFNWIIDVNIMSRDTKFCWLLLNQTKVLFPC